MKRMKFLLSVCLVGVLLTGCVKYNATMDIKKDKSMDFSIIYALDTSLFGEDQNIMTDEQIKEIESKGFSVTEYKEDKMKGYSLKRTIKNIDDVSSSDDVNFSLSGLLESNSYDYIFKVKKGFLKNTYVAKFSFDSSNSDLNLDGNNNNNNNNNNSDDDFSDDDLLFDNDDDTDNNVDFGDSDFEDNFNLGNDNSNFDYSSLTSSMDLSFNVNLPYSAKSNNATSSKDDNKSLSWKLSNNSNGSSIEFEFELYNMLYIFIAGGLVVLLIILVIVIVVGSKKKNKLDVNNISNSAINNNINNNSVNTDLNNNVVSNNVTSNSINNENNNVSTNTVDSSNLGLSQLNNIKPILSSETSSNNISDQSNVDITNNLNPIEVSNDISTSVNTNSSSSMDLSQEVSSISNGSLNVNTLDQTISIDNTLNQGAFGQSSNNTSGVVQNINSLNDNSNNLNNGISTTSVDLNTSNNQVASVIDLNNEIKK